MKGLTPLQFADRYLQPFRVKGEEIVPVHCPFCHGGQSRDKFTFALNQDKRTYNCKRGSCGATGTFRQLCKEFGEEADGDRQPFELMRRPPKTYKLPATPVVQNVKPDSKIERYLSKRGISRKTWEKRGVFEHQGNIAMPYYENGQLVLMKFRPAKKVQKGERKSWREEGGKPVFWGMDGCTHDLPLVITEGEMDALALDEAGVKNVVSVPSGNSDLTCVDECWDWLEKFNTVIIWPDNDDAGYDMLKKLINRLGAWRCKVVKSDRKDANEVLFFDGPDVAAEAVRNAEPVPIEGLVSLADIEPYDPATVVRAMSGIRGIDEVFGGFLMGQVSVWTGINSSGKSTLLGQVMLDAIDQGFTVCAYSGELPAQLFRYWIDLQAAGPGYVESRRDEVRDVETWRAKPSAVKMIREWYRDKFFLYDSFNQPNPDGMFEVFEYAARRYDAKVFLIDNLMTMVSTSNERDYYHRQSEFVGRAVDFAHKFDVHVHLVAHPRKANGRITKMDVAGSGDITNRADNVLAVHRVKEEEQKQLPAKLAGSTNIVEVFKSRFTGRQDIPIGLRFDETCKRFYMLSDSGANKQFGWLEQQKQSELTLIRGGKWEAF